MKLNFLRKLGITGASAYVSGKILDKIVGAGTIEAGIVKVGGAYMLHDEKKGSDIKGVIYGVGIDGALDIITALTAGSENVSGTLETL